MPSEPKIEVKQIDYHRNGIGGAPFHVILFSWQDDHYGGGENFMATVFEQSGAVAVLDVDKLHEGNVRFGSNSWRGDNFEPELRQAIVNYQKQSSFT